MLCELSHRPLHSSLLSSSKGGWRARDQCIPLQPAEETDFWVVLFGVSSLWLIHLLYLSERCRSPIHSKAHSFQTTRIMDSTGVITVNGRDNTWDVRLRNGFWMLHTNREMLYNMLIFMFVSLFHFHSPLTNTWTPAMKPFVKNPLPECEIELPRKSVELPLHSQMHNIHS